MSRYRPAVVGILAVAVLLSTVWANTSASAEEELVTAPAESEAPVDDVATEEPITVEDEPVVVPPAEDPIVEEIATEDPGVVAPAEVLVAEPTLPGAPTSPSATPGDGALSGATDAVTPRSVATFVVERQPRRRVVYGNRSRVRVALVTAGGVGVPNQRVNLLARVSRSSRWTRVDSDTTGSHGRVTLGTTLRASAALRVRHPIGGVVARDKALRSVVVAKRVAASVTRRQSRLGEVMVVRGQVSPRQRVGSPVVLQRRVDGEWRRAAVGRMTTQRRYVTRWKPARVGAYVLRVRKDGDNRLAEGVSRRWRHDVKPETAADIAADILRDPGITLADVHVSYGSDAATAERNIIDVANGRRANTSCYGRAPCSLTPLDLRMLRAVREMGQRGTLTVSEFAGGNHAPRSDHYRGRAVDITWVNGRHVGYGSGYGMAVDMCREYGASEIYSPSHDPWGGHHNHVHCGWSSP